MILPSAISGTFLAQQPSTSRRPPSQPPSGDGQPAYCGRLPRHLPSWAHADLVGFFMLALANRGPTRGLPRSGSPPTVRWPAGWPHLQQLPAASQVQGRLSPRLGWQPSSFLGLTGGEAECVYVLAERLRSIDAVAQELGATWPSLRKAFQRHVLGMPARNRRPSSSERPATPSRIRCSWPSAWCSFAGNGRRRAA